MEQVPTIGRIVHYKLTADDATAINRRRTDGKSISDRMKSCVVNPQGGPDLSAWPAGAQAHIGNDVKEGDMFPMTIVKVWGTGPESAVNGQVHLDGNDVFWATSRTVGIQPGQFGWPARS